MAKVGIVMGSDSDMPVMGKAAAVLEEFGIDYEMRVISAHREPDIFFEYARNAEADGLSPALEVTATVLNINDGHNQELMTACQAFSDYAHLVG